MIFGHIVQHVFGASHKQRGLFSAKEMFPRKKGNSHECLSRADKVIHCSREVLGKWRATESSLGEFCSLLVNLLLDNGNKS